MANDQIKKADNGTYYFRANLGFDHSTGKRIQKYRSGFKTKKEAKEEYAKLVLQFASQSLPTEQKRICLLYTSDAADDQLCLDLGGRRIIKKKKT